MKVIKNCEENLRELFDMYGVHIDKEDLDAVLYNVKVDCASIKTKMNGEDVFHEAYNRIKREYE